jgi:DNA-binding response OmpR family regulator
MRILIVEDEPVTSKIIAEVLQAADYKVCGVKDGVKALTMLEKENYDLVILDIMLPTMNGFEVCRRIKQIPGKYGRPYIMMLTAKTEVKDLAFGLDLGADDYLKKPFETLELISRVKVLLRRKQSFKDEKGVYQYKNLVVDLNRAIVTENSKEIRFFKKEIELLAYLCINQGITLERNKIYEEIWEEPYFEGNRALDVCISRIKKKSKIIMENLKTIRGIGYKLK